MKRLVYWIAATLLIVALLAVIFTGANAIAEQHWPLGIIWGGVIVLLGVLLWWVGRRKSARIREKWIPVRPKNYRRIALYAIQHAGNPVVLMNGRQINDFSESGTAQSRSWDSMIIPTRCGSWKAVVNWPTTAPLNVG